MGEQLPQPVWLTAQAEGTSSAALRGFRKLNHKES